MRSTRDPTAAAIKTLKAGQPISAPNVVNWRFAFPTPALQPHTPKRTSEERAMATGFGVDQEAVRVTVTATWAANSPWRTGLSLTLDGNAPRPGLRYVLLAPRSVPLPADVAQKHQLHLRLAEADVAKLRDFVRRCGTKEDGADTEEYSLGGGQFFRVWDKPGESAVGVLMGKLARREREALERVAWD